MNNTVRIKAADMFPVISEILHENGTVWIIVTGSSMYPFLRANKDQVQLVKCSFDTIGVGDIVLIKRKFSEQYVLHRVLKKKDNTFYIIGDAQQWVEGPLEPEQLVAVVTAIRKGKHIIKCSSIILRFMVVLWRIAIPARNKILYVIGVMARVYRRVFRKRKSTGNNN